MGFNLPNYPYKIFSNIPFNITAEIIKKITLGNNPPQVSYLFIQKEAAAKFMGMPFNKQNSQISVLLYPWFEFSVAYEFDHKDFFPKPAVNIILLEIKKRLKPLIETPKKDKYFDFVTYCFNRFKPYLIGGVPSKINFNRWLNLFKLFLESPPNRQNLVGDSYTNQLLQQQTLKKIHRTRIDKGWREFRKT